MSKELEALEIIKNAPTIYVGFPSDVYTRCSFECKAIEKALKALEIIKRLVDFNVYEMQGSYYLTTGNNYRGQIHITQEEYDLLKEVLCEQR